MSGDSRYNGFRYTLGEDYTQNRCIDSIASFPHNLRIFLLEQEVDQVHYQDRIRQASSNTSNQ